MLSVGWPEDRQNNSPDWAGCKPVISCSPGAPPASEPTLAWTGHLTFPPESPKPSLLTCRISPSSSLRCQQTSEDSSSRSWIRNCRRLRDSGISSTSAAIAPVWDVLQRPAFWAWSYQVLLDLDLTYHSPGFIIVEIHQISQFARFLELFLVRSIDKLLGKADSVPQVVAEIFLIWSLCVSWQSDHTLPTAAPFPPLRCRLALAAGITPTFRQIAWHFIKPVTS